MSYDTDEAIPPQVIQDALQRVIGSHEFINSERKRRFLKFIVQKTLAGHADQIKAYTIAVDVFGRDPSFDPGIDPVVRIEAGRLRRCLEHYYLTEGAADPVRITIPKGGYVPRFTTTKDPVLSGPQILGNNDQTDGRQPGEINLARENLARENSPREAEDQALAVTVSPHPPVTTPRLLSLRRPHLMTSILSLAAVLVVALMGAAVYLQTRTSEEGRTITQQTPSLMVLPFENDGGDPAQDIFAKGITEEVIGGLIRFKNVLVFGAGTSFRYRTEPALRDAVPDVHVDYVLKGSISRVGSQIQINVALLQAADNQYLWSDRFRREFTPGNMIDLRHDMAMQVARVLAQPHGVIYNKEVLNSAGLPPESLSSYECMLRARDYWRLPGVDLHGRIRTCLERAIQSDPQYADAWAALAMIYIDEARVGFNPNTARPDPLDTALKLANHARELAPDNPLPLQAAGLAHWLRREPLLSIDAYERAHALNPNDSEILGDLGRSYSLIGNWDKGIPLIREAYERNPAQPGWYRLILVLFHYIHGRYDEALAEAQRIGMPDLVYTHVVLAMIYGQTGQNAAARHEVDEILRIDPGFADKAVSDFERRNIHPAIIAKITDGLRKAGLAIPSNWNSSDRKG
ncbi:hypothetical protein [Skermanella pratensis]|uniref:hypothetical protein n=1 Tax=Skermanella pratensis TaxID=2233999 RepID=UPI001300FE41|nr:hypothetical protein [Skermanella pratensis]